MNQIEVRAYLDLAARLGSARMVDLTPGETVGSLTRALGLTEEEVGLVMVNGCRADSGRVLSVGERVAYFPPYVPFHKIYGMCVL